MATLTIAEFSEGPRELALPVRMVSDWHLGHPGAAVRDVAQVESVLAGAGTLVMVGDGREELVKGWRAEADRLWDELRTACERQGVGLIALTGNHDPDASSDGWLKLGEGRILVTHGDMIYETSSPWSRELFDKRKEVMALLESRKTESLDERWDCAREVGRLLRPRGKTPEGLVGYLKLAFWPPERLVEIGKVWTGFAAEGNRFLEAFAPDCDHLVCGHFHRPGRFHVGHRTIWNTGSLMKMCKGLAIDFDGESLAAQRVILK
ncbi:hypothetical protein [Roseibacillus persicicus]|uniref:hypothetical protein n=1 Tax=Roseibacillus persicicus TaxID=454148 RepID=UPI00280DB12D|nr:hypothetical protein [Roseibacillus persicicus]MDQ8191784.1 hypothetical protein [Roseibacillus persicicus]